MPMKTWVALVLLAAMLSGCGYFRKVGECRRLSRQVNRALDEIAAAHDAGSATAATYTDLAGRYERLARDVNDAAKNDDALGRTLKEYSTSFQETARALRTLADAMEKNDVVSLGRLKRDMGNHVRRDKTLALRIEGLCSDP